MPKTVYSIFYAKNSLQHLLCQQQSTSLTYQKYPTFFPSCELIEGKESLMTAEVKIDKKTKQLIDNSVEAAHDLQVLAFLYLISSQMVFDVV